MRVQIVAPAPTVGLRRDVEVLTPLLERAGCSVVPVYGERPPRWRRWARGARSACGRAAFDLNVFLERPNRRYLGDARRHVLIPNQEWVTDGHRGALGSMDAVWCKSRHAVAIFDGMGLATRHTGFACVERRGGTPERDWDAFLHVAGSSHRGETRLLLGAWARHPEWPTLTLVCGVHADPTALPANVTGVDGFLPDDRLCDLQRRCGVHLCHSEVEGFGHLIAEGLSAGALVMTTDADPMREQVPPGCGVLIEPCGSSPQHLGTRYTLSVEAVERGVSQVLAMSPAERAAVAGRGRAASEHARRAFEGAIAEALHAVRVTPRARARPARLRTGSLSPG